jgi:hypothetical protein
MKSLRDKRRCVSCNKFLDPGYKEKNKLSTDGVLIESGTLSLKVNKSIQPELPNQPERLILC